MKKVLLTFFGVSFILCSAIWIGQNHRQTSAFQDQEKICSLDFRHFTHSEDDEDKYWTQCKLDEGSRNYLVYVKSYEKHTLDGMLDIAVIIEAEDTSYIGNVFTFETQGSFFSGSDVLHTSRDSLVPGDTLMFHLPALASLACTAGL